MPHLPDALHVGFSKCASTFLQAFFNEHPEIFLVNQSHFFAPFENSPYDSGVENYYRKFDDAAPNQVQLESDEHIMLPLFHPVLSAAATTLNAVREVSHRIKNIQPDAKIIMVIRNQVGLIVSRYSEYVLGGGKDNFQFFVNQMLNCSSDGVNYYQNHYARIIEVLHGDFGKENVLIILQEDLAMNEARIIERLCRFLSVTTIQPKQRGVISKRVGLSKLGIQVVRGMNKVLVKRQEMSHKRADVRIPYLLYKLLQRSVREIDYRLPKMIKGDKNEILTPELEALIRDEFKSDNAHLATLLDRDLDRLGY